MGSMFLKSKVLKAFKMFLFCGPTYTLVGIYPKEIEQKLGLLFLNNMFLKYNHDFYCFPYSAPEKAMATHCSTLAWKIPWAEEPGGLLSMGLHRVGHD